MPEMHLWDPKVKIVLLVYLLQDIKRRINDFMKDGKLSHITKNRLDAACFQHDSAYNKHKDSLNRKKYDIVLKNKALKIATDPKVNGYLRALVSMVYNNFDERTKGSGIEIKQLAEELHKPIINNFKRRKDDLII